MGQMNRIVPVVALVVIAFALQLTLVVLNCWQSPATVAKQFIKDYYYLDADMQKSLCAKEGDPEDLVDNYLYSKQVEAAQRGFDVTYLRKLFTHIHVETKHQDAQTAEVHITGTLRTAINPAYMVIGKLKFFNIGKDYHVDTPIELVKENGKWRVCGKAMDINS